MAADARSLPHLDQRVDVAADAGGYRHRLLPAISATLSRRGSGWRRPANRKYCNFGRAWATIAARNLHQAAQQIVSQHAGRFPCTVDELQTLAGVGRYTAGAIASFAFDQPAPILEANTIRLFSRLLSLSDPCHTAAAQRQLWQFAESLLPARGGAGLVNQAAMELGSLVCTPRDPACSTCPLRRHCLAYQQGIERQLPVQKADVARQALTHVGLLIRDRRQRVLLRCNTGGRWWEGLWDLPWIELSLGARRQLDERSFETMQSDFARQHELHCQPLRHMQTIDHAVTRYQITYHCVSAKLLGGWKRRSPARWQWASLDRLPPMVARFQRLRWDDQAG